MKHEKMRLSREISGGEKNPKQIQLMERKTTQSVKLEGSAPCVGFVTSCGPCILLKTPTQGERG